MNQTGTGGDEINCGKPDGDGVKDPIQGRVKGRMKKRNAEHPTFNIH
jgi:hypothetical protein